MPRVRFVVLSTTCTRHRAKRAPARQQETSGGKQKICRQFRNEGLQGGPGQDERNLGRGARTGVQRRARLTQQLGRCRPPVRTIRHRKAEESTRLCEKLFSRATDAPRFSPLKIGPNHRV